MTAIVCKIDSVRKHPDSDNLTIVSVAGNEVIANLNDEGNPRWEAGELCVYVAENSIVPEDALKERGYWEEGTKKGMLGGSKGNRVARRRFAGVESRGLLFKVTPDVDLHVELGDDLSEFFNITEYAR